MAKKKEKENEEIEKEKETFDLEKALENVNPFMIEGFKRFIADKKVSTEKKFLELLKEYGGD